MRKNWKGNGVLHFVTAAAFVVFVVLGVASTTFSPATIELNDYYRKMLQSPAGNERVFDSVKIEGTATFNTINSPYTITQNQRLSVTKSVPQGTQRHPDEAILDRLLNEAKRQYPREELDIRNAKTDGYTVKSTGTENYQEAVNVNGTTQYVTKTRNVYTCVLIYVADVITTQPMPGPVAHSENFTMPGLTRADIYRRASNWIDDNKTRRRIILESSNFDVGRLRGTISCAAIADQTYRVISTFTIDIYDARAEIRFFDTVIQRADRNDPTMKTFLAPEQVFLQSIADAALAEIVDFSTTLRSYIVSQ
jgi:hypothetical protein